MPYSPALDFYVIKAKLLNGPSDVAARLYAQATKAEPAVTADLESVATAVGAELGGLEHRLKTVDSLTRKLTTYAAEGRENQEVTDALRYTMVLPDAVYTDGVASALSLLADAYYLLVESKNYWVDHDWSEWNGNYRGLNTVLRTPQDYRFEVQFHSESSWAVKSLDSYEELYHRLRTETDPAELERLLEQAAEYWRGVPIPKRADLLARSLVKLWNCAPTS